MSKEGGNGVYRNFIGTSDRQVRPDSVFSRLFHGCEDSFSQFLGFSSLKLRP